MVGISERLLSIVLQLSYICSSWFCACSRFRNLLSLFNRYKVCLCETKKYNLFAHRDWIASMTKSLRHKIFLHARSHASIISWQCCNFQIAIDRFCRIKSSTKKSIVCHKLLNVSFTNIRVLNKRLSTCFICVFYLEKLCKPLRKLLYNIF